MHYRCRCFLNHAFSLPVNALISVCAIARCLGHFGAWARVAGPEGGVQRSWICWECAAGSWRPWQQVATRLRAHPSSAYRSSAVQSMISCAFTASNAAISVRRHALIRVGWSAVLWSVGGSMHAAEASHLAWCSPVAVRKVIVSPDDLFRPPLDCWRDPSARITAAQ